VTDGPRPAPLLALAVLVDFDGTIATADLSDEVMRRHAPLDAWAPLERAYLDGLIGSRELLTRQAALLDDRDGAIEAMGRGEGHDPTFVAFATSLLARGVAVEVVSDGFGFFVEPALRAMGLADVPVFTASTTFDDGRVEIDFPNGHPRCLVCGTCKRERILVHRRAGRHVVFVGDGFSDLYAAAHADTVFAKHHLAELCRERDLPFRAWIDFADVAASIDADLAAGQYAVAVSTEFRCGPEVWPVDTTTPLWGNGLAPRAVADRSGPA
jgi:2-hydroxy-3-keto-5-methylthiopentenyl-1-phosphate phosphatase